MRRVTLETAADPASWTRARRAEVAALFDSMADHWTADHDSPRRRMPLLDALDRGDLPTGPVVEVGAGTGIGTSVLLERFDLVVPIDLSLEMLHHAPVPRRVRADSCCLPVRSGAAAVVVLVNMLLFPGEVDRILAPGGAVVWVNTVGERTPIHLSPTEVAEALPGRWEGVASRAGDGLWAVLRRG